MSGVVVKRSFSLALACAVCTFAAAVHAGERLYLLDEAYRERTGNWVITCTDYARTASGKMKPYNSCSLRRLLVPDTLTGGNALIITAVHGRESIVPPVGDRYCRKQPHARAVDGTFIRDWPFGRQLQTLKTGKLYSEEFMPRGWPECWIVVRKAPLDGFERAHLRFREVARARGALW